MLIEGSTDLDNLDLMSRRESSQSDDGSLFGQLDGADTLFSDLAEDVDDSLPVHLGDTSRAPIEPVVSINPIRFPFAGSTSLLVSNAQPVSSNNSTIPSQPQPGGVTISPIPSRRGPGRPRKDGKVPIQRKNLFPGRPRMRGRKTLNVLGTTPSIASDTNNPAPTIGSFNVGCAVSIRPISGPSVPRTGPDPGRVELTISSSSYYQPTASSSTNFMINTDSMGLPGESKGNLKTCAFCNLGENTALGLGEVIRCEPTPGFIVAKRSTRARRSPDIDDAFDSSILSPVKIGKLRFSY